MKFLVAAAITATASVRAAVPAFPRVRYDRGITTFSPDGSLLQVEYAMSVGEKGAPALAVTDDEGGVFLIAEASDDESDDLLSMGEKLIELDEHVWMAVSGFRADGRVLGDRARQECQEYRLSYGEAPTVRHVAAFVADLQHGFTRTGGARPFGVSCLIVGLDPVTGLSYKDVDYGTATAASRVSRTGGSTGDTGTGDTVTDDNGTDDSTIGNSGGTSGNSVGTLGGSETITSTSGGSSGGSLEGEEAKEARDKSVVAPVLTSPKTTTTTTTPTRTRTVARVFRTDASGSLSEWRGGMAIGLHAMPAIEVIAAATAAATATATTATSVEANADTDADATLVPRPSPPPLPGPAVTAHHRLGVGFSALAAALNKKGTTQRGGNGGEHCEEEEEEDEEGEEESKGTEEDNGRTSTSTSSPTTSSLASRRREGTPSSSSSKRRVVADVVHLRPAESYALFPAAPSKRRSESGGGSRADDSDAEGTTSSSASSSWCPALVPRGSARPFCTSTRTRTSLP